MKVATFIVGGVTRFGIVKPDGVVDAVRLFDKRYGSVKAALAAGAMDQLRRLAQNAKPDYRTDTVTLLPVIPDPDKILCIGINYATHVRETGRETPKYPMIFVRFANTQVGHGQSMIKPRVSDKFDFEGELAVVIGRRGRHIAKEKALEHVAGYACYNDGSVRDWQRHTVQFTPGKNFVSTGAFGPWMVTADEISDPSQLTLTTRLNGEIMQQAPVSDLIFTVPDLIAYISTFTELIPGDVIVTGTPGGVGNYREPPLFMKQGDRIEVEISNIGVLANPIVAEESAG
ncbi:MAG: 5-carboxymethyl-2-hydroxymuconate isomerase [Proteobacteria bacterium]|nr:MAG: 5-carboxymethyl-2-hydroxymuconate isomerase [Pseudomonadota bacterium]